MEILSDATFRGNISINGGNFSVTRKGESSPILETNSTFGLRIYETEFTDSLIVGTNADIHGGVCVGDSIGIHYDARINGSVYIQSELSLKGKSIKTWTDLCVYLGSHFAPSAISDTVNLNTCKIDSVCTKIECIDYEVSSLCTAVSSLPKFCSINLPSDVPADCTRFTICAHGNHPVERAYYMFMTKGTNPMKPVNIDLEARCDSTTYNNWSFVATKSSGFEMKSSDGYVLKFFYHDC